MIRFNFSRIGNIFFKTCVLDLKNPLIDRCRIKVKYHNERVYLYKGREVRVILMGVLEGKIYCYTYFLNSFHTAHETRL